MLKPISLPAFVYSFGQPPSGGCVLKHDKGRRFFSIDNQPPSGGCVLKLVGG